MNSPKQRRVISALNSLSFQFLNTRFGERNIRCPFWMNYDPLYKDTAYFKYFAKGGKRSPSEMNKWIQKCVNKQNINPASISNYSEDLFMLRNGIGIDCSGFVYQCLQSAFKSLGGHNFKEKLVARDGKQKGIRRIGVKDLGSSRNAISIEKIDQINPGDFIIKGGSHSAIIVEKKRNKIKVVHVSNEIKSSGIHRFDIEIVKPQGSIFEQDWQEISYDGLPYSAHMLTKIKKADGIKRLKIIDALYKAK